MKFETKYDVGDEAYRVSKIHIGFKYEGFVVKKCIVAQVKIETGYRNGEFDDCVITNVLYDVADDREDCSLSTTLNEDDLYGTFEEAKAEADRRNEWQISYFEDVIKELDALKDRKR